VKRLTVTCTCSSFHSERCRDVIPRLLQGNRLAPHRDLCRVLDRPNPLRQCLHELLDLLLQSLHGTVRHQHGWHHCRLGPHGAWYRTKVCRRSLPTNLEMALMRFQNPLPLRLYLDVHHSGRHWWRLTRTLHRGILGRRWPTPRLVCRIPVHRRHGVLQSHDRDPLPPTRYQDCQRRPRPLLRGQHRHRVCDSVHAQPVRLKLFTHFTED
jgi:hypothetical protein